MTDTCRHIEERFVETGDALLREPDISAHISSCAHCSGVYAALNELDPMLREMSVLDMHHGEDLASNVLASVSSGGADARSESQPLTIKVNGNITVAAPPGSPSGPDWSQPGPWQRPRSPMGRRVYVALAAMSMTATIAAAAVVIVVVQPAQLMQPTEPVALQPTAAAAPEPLPEMPWADPPEVFHEAAPPPAKPAPNAGLRQTRAGAVREGIDVEYRGNKSGGKSLGKSSASDDTRSDNFNQPRMEKLALNDIVNGVKKNAAKVAPCLKAARNKAELQPGNYKFILDWRIQPDGSVTDARLKGPSSVMATSLPGCFAKNMRRWKFPRSSKGAPVKNFPFGPVTLE